jgi:hypothetical protein
MTKDTSLIIKSELLWWAITAILVVVVLYPIYSSVGIYPFWQPNIIYIVVFVTLARYIFLLKHTPLRFVQWVKVVALVLCIPLAFYLIKELHAFQLFTDEIGLQTLYSNLSDKSQSRLMEYTKTEMLFFGVGSVIVSVIFPFRMLISFWRTYNLGTT